MNTMKRTIALALEDRAHETVIRALFARIFSDEDQNLHDWDLVVLILYFPLAAKHTIIYNLYNKHSLRPSQIFWH